jgi:hypothetical protein
MYVLVYNAAHFSNDARLLFYRQIKGAFPLYKLTAIEPGKMRRSAKTLYIVNY